VRAPTDALLRARDVLGYRPLLRALGSPDLKAGYKQSGAYSTRTPSGTARPPRGSRPRDVNYQSRMPAAQEPTAQRPAHALRELGESDTTDLQAVVDDGKLRHRRMCNARVAHKITRLLFVQSRFDPRPRYPRRTVQPACPYGIRSGLTSRYSDLRRLSERGQLSGGVANLNG
jgi:hypothetical protein